MDIRQKFLDCPDARLEELAIPEIGITVYVPCLPAADHQQLRDLFKSHKGVDSELLTALFATRNADGTRVFADSDLEALGKKPSRIIERISDRYWELNSVSDAEKNSGATPTSAGE